MTDAINLLGKLRKWHDEVCARLEADGCAVEFTDPVPTRPKPSAAVMVHTSSRIAKLTIWTSGEAELEFADVLSGEVAQEHREILGDPGLADATDTLVSWVRGA